MISLTYEKKKCHLVEYVTNFTHETIVIEKKI